MIRLCAVVVLSFGVQAFGAEKQIQLAAVPPSGVDIPEAKLTFWGEHLGQQMSFTGIRVVTPREIASVLGLERQKELLGCGDDSSSCITELANALGADGLVLADIGRFGESYQLNIRVLAAADAAPLASFSSRVTGDEAVLDELSRAAKVLARSTYQKFGRLPPEHLNEVSTSRSGGGVRSYAWAPAALGVAGLGTGVVLMLMAGADHRELTGAGPPLSDEQAQRIRDSGSTKQTVAATALTVGAAGLVGAAAMFLLGGPDDAPQVSMTLNTDSASFVMSGRF